jgi:hypothetical protein
VIKSKVELNGLVGTEQEQKKQVAFTNLQKLKKEVTSLYLQKEK